MGYTSFSNSAVMTGNPDEIWEAFAHPAISNLYAEHKISFVPPEGFTLTPGQSWEEHHGEECDYDKVSWTITHHVEQSVLEFRGKQTGVLQRIQLRMEPAENGYRLTETIHFSPTTGGKVGNSIFAWLLLGTGVLAKMSNDKGQTFELLLDYLTNGAKNTAPGESNK